MDIKINSMKLELGHARKLESAAQADLIFNSRDGIRLNLYDRDESWEGMVDVEVEGDWIVLKIHRNTHSTTWVTDPPEIIKLVPLDPDKQLPLPGD